MIWRGAELEERVDRALGRGLVGIGVAVSVETKRVTHRVSGTLARSVHAAPAEEDHGGDEAQAKTDDLLLANPNPETTDTPLGPTLEVGSWLPYACVEWVGRGHPGVTQGLEVVRGVRAESIMAKAFAEEGLIL